ncbi:hypothetical protein JMUB6875_51540 [Nocardia sp. JMUB6875]|uniref:transposase n=1 Tax=Nocardia sp. JMUB6875 TaxID=3158170 RepID=UPI0032E63808
MTLLRHIRALPDPVRPTPRVLGVDDFALRRGHHYGTMIDIESRRPIEVLGDRTAETLAAWLRAHPGVEIVCRDRAGAYAEGAAVGAPHAIQVADRWHIWNNLAPAVERTVARHRNCLSTATSIEPSLEREATPVLTDQSRPIAGPPPPSDRLDRTAIRTRQRHNEIHALIAQGLSLRAICTRLGLARGTVRRFARADSAEELLVNNGTGYRDSILDEFKPYLQKRWAEGATNATELFDEITARGFRGRPNLVRAYLHPFRAGQPASRATVKPPAVRRVVGWLMTDPAHLDPADGQHLDAILDASPALAGLAGPVRPFATICAAGRDARRRPRMFDPKMVTSAGPTWVLCSGPNRVGEAGGVQV